MFRVFLITIFFSFPAIAQPVLLICDSGDISIAGNGTIRCSGAGWVEFTEQNLIDFIEANVPDSGSGDSDFWVDLTADEVAELSAAILVIMSLSFGIRVLKKTLAPNL